jgi:hypothetical protein
MWNPIKVLNLAKMKYEELDMKPKSSNFPEDVHMYDLLVNFLGIHWNDVNISIETVETLEEIETNSDGSGSCDSSEESCADKSMQQEYLPRPKKQKTEIPFSDKEKAVKCWLNEGGKTFSKLSNVQNRFRFIKSERELYKWKKELHEERNMHQNETRKSLKELLFERFRTAQYTFR